MISVAVSTVADGNMYIPTDLTNLEVLHNRQQWFEKLRISLEGACRVAINYHTDDFCRYRIVDESHRSDGMQGASTAPADALVTTTQGLVLFLPVADCVAATLYDESKGVLMLTHLGRHSLEQHGGVKSVEFLVREFGVDPADLKVWLSPAPNKEAYSIFKLDGKGMKEAALEQLQQAGVRFENITNNPADTATDDRYYSHSEFLKGNKPTDGRFAMLAVML